MEILKSFLVGAALLLAPTFSFGSTFGAGNYGVSDYDGIRSIWTPGGQYNSLVRGNNVSNLWSFSDTTLDYDGATATMKGKVTNVTDANLMFDLDLSFAVNTNPQPGYCQFNGTDKGCLNGPYAGVDPSSWTYFDFLSGTLTGSAGSAIETVAFKITDNLMHRPQAGLGANALEEEDLGFSMWFNYKRTAGNKYVGKYHIGYKGNGDINVDLELPPVPLPASGLFLLAAIGGLAMSKRRRVASA